MGKKGLIGRVVGHALPKDVLTIFSKLLLLLFVCGVVNTLERYSAKAVAFSFSVFSQLPFSCRIGGMWVIGFLNCFVAFQIVWSSFDKVLIYVWNVAFRVTWRAASSCLVSWLCTLLPIGFRFLCHLFLALRFSVTISLICGGVRLIGSFPGITGCVDLHVASCIRHVI